MSTTNKTSKGGKTKSDKGQKTEKTDTGKISIDKNITKENAKNEEILKQKVQTVIEMTKRSEEEVCLALYECSYDVTQAVNMLYETLKEGGQWLVKKKKSRQSGQKQDKQEGGDQGTDTVATEDWGDGSALPTGNQGRERGGDKERQRSKSSGGPRGGRHGDSRGWRGREKQENERNLADSDGGNRSERWGERRGGRSDRRGGPGRGGRGGGRAGGPGRFGNRGSRNNSYKQPIDTWDNNNSNTWDNSTVATANNVEETWDDFPVSDEWSTEEYTGSLADTKVFTPSTQTVPELSGENQHEGPLDAASQQLGQTLQINQTSGGVSNLPSQSPIPMGGTLNAAQTKYLNQLTSQNNDNYGTQSGINHYQTGAAPLPASGQQIPQNYGNVTSQSYSAASQTYGGVYGTNNNAQNSTYVNNVYPANTYVGGTTDSNVPSHPPLRPKTQRARVPPPSKIPSSAVEMPGELTMAYLDVQFGAMDFMSDSNSFDGVSDCKYGTTNNSGLESANATASSNLNDLGNTNQSTNLDNYSQKSNNQNSITSALTQSHSTVDNIPTSEHVSGGNYVTSRTATAVSQSALPQVTLDLSKSSDSHSYSQASNYNSYNKASYNSSYSGAQTSTTSSYQSGTSYVNSQSGSYNAPSANSYQNSYSSATSYQPNTNSNAFPSITQQNSYSTNNQSYSQSTSQSVYGANAGLNSSSAYGNTSTSQYNNYNSTSNHKLVKEGSGYESVSTTQTTTAGSATSTALPMSQSTVSTTKTASTTGKNSNSAVSSMPPGVATPVMSTPYSMLQMPFYQQPIYSYEDVQLLQQRMPHMTSPYYDVSYQTPTTLTAVRGDHGAAAAALGGGVGYSAAISGDGRFATGRGADSASPVPTASTMPGQQTTVAQGHQAGPILAGTAAPPYFFATHFNAVPNYPFYQLPTATNAHGTNSSSQYAKPGAYSSGYGYDTLNQTQDYGKGTYVTNTQGQKSGGTASSTGSSGNDLTTMYGKSHTALGKVNSYDKQAFHSGTPPPFTGTLHGSQSAGLAPSGTGYPPQVYIPSMAPHQQHHSTQLMHQPLHQDSGNNSGQRSQASNQSKTGGKQFPGSYWNQS